MIGISTINAICKILHKHELNSGHLLFESVRRFQLLYQKHGTVLKGHSACPNHDIKGSSSTISRHSKWNVQSWWEHLPTSPVVGITTPNIHKSWWCWITIYITHKPVWNNYSNIHLTTSNIHLITVTIMAIHGHTWPYMAICGPCSHSGAGHPCQDFQVSGCWVPVESVILRHSDARAEHWFTGNWEEASSNSMVTS